MGICLNPLINCASCTRFPQIDYDAELYLSCVNTHNLWLKIISKKCFSFGLDNNEYKSILQDALVLAWTRKGKYDYRIAKTSTFFNFDLKTAIHNFHHSKNLMIINAQGLPDASDSENKKERRNTTFEQSEKFRTQPDLNSGVYAAELAQAIRDKRMFKELFNKFVKRTELIESKKELLLHYMSEIVLKTKKNGTGYSHERESMRDFKENYNDEIMSLGPNNSLATNWARLLQLYHDFYEFCIKETRNQHN